MKREASEAVERLLGRLVREFGEVDAEKITKVLAEEIGGFRLTFPDVVDMARMARNRLICDSFTGTNYEELALRHQVHQSQIRRILSAQRPAGGGAL